MDRVFVPHRRADLSTALFADADHPLVAATLERVTRRRIDYLTRQFSELGFNGAEALRRARLAYTSFLRLSQLRHHLPALAPDVPDTAPYIALRRDALVRRDEHRQQQPHDRGRR